MQRKNWSTPQHCVRYSQIRPGSLGILQNTKRIREIIDGPIQWMGTRNPTLIIQAKSTLLNQYGGLIRMKYVWQPFLRNKGHRCWSKKNIKARTRRGTMWSNRSKATYPPKNNSWLVKGRNKQNKNSGDGIIPKIQKTDTLLLGSQNTLVMIHAEMLVSSFTKTI